MPLILRTRSFLLSLIGIFLFLLVDGQTVTLYKPITNTSFYDSLVVLKWKDVPNGAPYTVEISTDSTFNTVTYTQVGIPSANLHISLNYGYVYWWRVHAAVGTVSAIRKFEVISRHTLPQPAIWFRADSSLSTNGSLVTAWTDLGDSSRNASQPSAALQPEKNTIGIAGNPYVHFGKTGGAGQATYLVHASVRFAAPNFTVVSTHRLSSTAVILGYMLGGYQTGLFAGGPYSGGWSTGIFDGVNGRRISGAPFTQWATLSYSPSQIWRNSVTQTMTGVNATQLKFAQIGTATDLPATLFFHGDLAEIMIFANALPDSTRRKFERYQMGKYGSVVQLPYDTNVCAPNLTLTLPGGTDEYSAIVWSTGATTATVNLTANGTYWVRGTSRIGNYITTDTIRVKGIFPLPQITPNTHQYFCFNRDTITFEKVTSAPGVIYTWSDGSTGDSLPVTLGDKVYITAYDPVSGCIIPSDTVLVTHKTKADFNNSPICPDTDAEFTDLSLDLSNDTISSRAWNFGDPGTVLDTSSQTNGHWNYANSGTYSVYLKVTASDGCADSIAKNVIVKPTATADFNWQGACYGKPTQFFDASVPEVGTQVTGYQWIFGPGITSSFVNPAVTFDTADVYSVKLKVFTASGCTDTVLLQIPVNKGVDAAFSIPDSLCAGQTVPVLDESQGVNDNITQWVWRFGNNTPVNGQNPQFAFQGTGNRIVRLTATTAAGCADSAQKAVYVRPSPTAAFVFGVNGGTPPFTPTINNQSTGATAYAWNYGNGFTDFSLTPTLPAFADTGTYTVTLAVSNPEGCTDTALHTFVVFTGDRTLQLMEATCVLDGDYVTYTARVLNKGALEVNRITFGGNLNYNSVLREKWEGTLLSGQVMEYEFNSSAKYFTDANFCCVRIEDFNDTLTVQAPDNEICKPLTDNAWFSTAYPTPTDGVITIDHTLPFADKLSATLCSVDGKVLRILFTEKPVAAGFGSSTADIADLRSGLYVVRFTYRDKNYSVKVLKK